MKDPGQGHTNLVFTPSTVSVHAQLRSLASKAAKVVLSCVPEGFESRQKAVEVLRYSTGDDHKHWQTLSRDLDPFSQQTVLFATFYHVLRHTERWDSDEFSRDLSRLPLLKSSIAALRTELHRDLMRAQTNLGWGGEASDGMLAEAPAEAVAQHDEDLPDSGNVTPSKSANKKRRTMALK